MSRFSRPLAATEAGHLPRKLSRMLPARSSGYATAVLLAGAAALAAPAAAQASAALPHPVAVPCSSSALVTTIQRANMAQSAVLLLQPGCNYILAQSADGKDGLPAITGNITIIGGHGTQISRAPSAGPFRILEVTGGSTLTLVNITVANGRLTDSGGVNAGAGIFDAGTLVLRNVRLIGNTDGDLAGALAVSKEGRAAITGSDLDSNSAASEGGAIFSFGDLTIDRSVLARNTGASGGAIATAPGAATRISSTVVTRNTASNGGGGGIANAGVLVLRGDRVTFNQATSAGGGILNISPGIVSLRFTVVAANTPDNCSPRDSIQGCRN
jgi:predicted outer membrane repeat protein